MRPPRAARSSACNSTVKPHGFVESPARSASLMRVFNLHAKVLLFAALHALERRHYFFARNLAVLVQHGVRQQVLIGLFQPCR